METKRKYIIIIIVFITSINIITTLWFFLVNLDAIQKIDVEVERKIEGDRKFNLKLPSHYNSRISLKADEDSPDKIEMIVIAEEIDLKTTLKLKKIADADPMGGLSYYPLFQFRR